MKRIIIGPGYPLRGGISESNQALDHFFQDSGEYSKIVSYSLQYPQFLFPGKKQTVDKPIDKVTNLSMINTLNPVSWFKTAKYIIRENPNYVILRYWHPYFSVCLSIISKLLKKKSIFIIGWVDNVHPHESIPFQKPLTSFFIKSCDAFLVMSKSVEKQLLQYPAVHNKEIIFSPHPIYNVFGPIINKFDARKRLGFSTSSIPGNFILFFGLVRKYKGLDLLLDVMGSSVIQKMNIKLIVAGEFYDSKEKYMKKIKSLDLDSCVVLHDFYIPNEDVAHYFCAADIVVQPYLSATQSGVSMVAYNFNKPMVLTNVGGLSEYVNDKKDGYLVDVKPEAIVSALKDYYVNKRESQFVAEIKNKKSSYSWKNLAGKFDSLYNNLNHE
ncbi:MAG: glycosyl transferase family 1 [Flavobacteriales bacterium]|nr:glycosyl transferase family 1 [Flavobacteriales bacterium]